MKTKPINGKIIKIKIDESSVLLDILNETEIFEAVTKKKKIFLKWGKLGSIIHVSFTPIFR